MGSDGELISTVCLYFLVFPIVCIQREINVALLISEITEILPIPTRISYGCSFCRIGGGYIITLNQDADTNYIAVHLRQVHVLFGYVHIPFTDMICDSRQCSIYCHLAVCITICSLTY